jgi:cytochrome b561
MALRNTETQYGAVAKTAHWLMALLLTGSFSLGFYMADLPPSPTRLRLFNYHKWLGVCAFIIVALRWLWRQAVAPPPLPATMHPWEKEAARIAHRLLYLFLFVAPLSGWLMNSARGYQTVLFGKLPIPDLLHKNPPLGAALEQVHLAVVQLLL